MHSRGSRTYHYTNYTIEDGFGDGSTKKDRSFVTIKGGRKVPARKSQFGYNSAEAFFPGNVMVPRWVIMLQDADGKTEKALIARARAEGHTHLHDPKVSPLESFRVLSRMLAHAWYGKAPGTHYTKKGTPIRIYRGEIAMSIRDLAEFAGWSYRKANSWLDVQLHFERMTRRVELGQTILRIESNRSRRISAIKRSLEANTLCVQ